METFWNKTSRSVREVSAKKDVSSKFKNDEFNRGEQYSSRLSATEPNFNKNSTMRSTSIVPIPHSQLQKKTHRMYLSSTRNARRYLLDSPRVRRRNETNQNIIKSQTSKRSTALNWWQIHANDGTVEIVFLQMAVSAVRNCHFSLKTHECPKLAKWTKPFQKEYKFIFFNPITFLLPS